MGSCLSGLGFTLGWVGICVCGFIGVCGLIL